MRELTKTEKALISILGIVIIGWGSYQFIITPQSHKLKNMKKEKIGYQEQITEMENILSKEEDINKRLKILMEEKDEIVLGYFPKLDQAQVTYLLNDLLEQDGIEIMDMNFDRPSYEEFGELQVKNMAISIPYEGSYDGIVDVIKSLQGSPRKILLESVSMDRDDEGSLRGSILLKIYGLDQIASAEGDVIKIPTEKRDFGITPFTAYSDYMKANESPEALPDSPANYAPGEVESSQDFNDYKPEPPDALELGDSGGYFDSTHVDKKESEEDALVATPATSIVLVDQEPVSFEAYTIENNTYINLRDFAYAITGTKKQFQISWDSQKGAISITSKKPYTPVGTELKKGSGVVKSPVLNNTKIYKDDVELDFISYTIDGNNYFNLRDLAQLSDIIITWDGATSTIGIDTSL